MENSNLNLHEQYMASSIGNEPYPGDKYVALAAIKKIFEGNDNLEF